MLEFATCQISFSHFCCSIDATPSSIKLAAFSCCSKCLLPLATPLAWPCAAGRVCVCVCGVGAVCVLACWPAGGRRAVGRAKRQAEARAREWIDFVFWREPYGRLEGRRRWAESQRSLKALKPKRYWRAAAARLPLMRLTGVCSWPRRVCAPLATARRPRPTAGLLLESRESGPIGPPAPAPPIDRRSLRIGPAHFAANSAARATELALCAPARLLVRRAPLLSP